MMRGKLWALATVLSGVAVFAVIARFVAIQYQIGNAHCIDDGAVVLFELARNVQELRAVFHANDPACYPTVVEYMRATNQVDLAFFIPAYTALACCAAAFLGGGLQRPLVMAAFAAALIAAAGDVLETRTLLQIGEAIEQRADMLSRSLAGAWLKFSMLALYGVLVTAICFTQSPSRRIVGVLALAPVAATALAARDQNQFAAYLVPAALVAWTPMLIVAAAALFAPRRAD